MIIHIFLERESGGDLNGAVEDATETDTVFKDLVDLNNGVVRLV